MREGVNGTIGWTYDGVWIRINPARPYLEGGAPRNAALVAMLCYAMICCAMLCYAMLCCAMICYAMLSDAMSCCAVLC
eukprot:1763581-Pyramimonas_sp.AAC.1